MDIAERIRRRRRDLGLTVRGLGKLVGVTGSAVAQWEAGGTITPKNQAALAHALGISIVEFLPPGSIESDVIVSDDNERLLISKFRQLDPSLREAYLRMIVVQADQQPPAH